MTELLNLLENISLRSVAVQVGLLSSLQLVKLRNKFITVTQLSKVNKLQ